MTSKALLVGINDYAPVGAGGPDLNGCVNDVRDFANTIDALGIVSIRPGSMRVLTNGNATRAKILAGLKWLLAGAKASDVLIFYYSGHGTYVTDTSHDEPDGRDEAICPHDFASAGIIKDDDIQALLNSLPAKVNLDVIFDSCFSGTATRIVVEGDSSTAAVAMTPRFIEPPLEDSLYAEAIPTLPVRGVFGSSRSERNLVPVSKMNHVLWAASRDNETSGEGPIGGVVRGYFTYAWCKCLRGAGIGVTRAKLDSLVSRYLANMTASQHPQTEGPKQSLSEKVFT